MIMIFHMIELYTLKRCKYPDTPDAMAGYINTAGLNILNKYDTEFASAFVALKG